MRKIFAAVSMIAAVFMFAAFTPTPTADAVVELDYLTLDLEVAPAACSEAGLPCGDCHDCLIDEWGDFPDGEIWMWMSCACPGVDPFYRFTTSTGIDECFH